jgi:hypothetical protein
VYPSHGYTVLADGSCHFSDGGIPLEPECLEALTPSSGAESMPALISGKEGEAVVRASLESQGYKISAERGNGETGTDIVQSQNEGCRVLGLRDLVGCGTDN